ncbi:MAG: hypothetical protein COA78_31860 [Blastopirellula sp.]|nr:MAG: hypothetical protein COA78_31860 [Blastopirellula sp.]
MSNRDKKQIPTVGFLTVIENKQHGLFGGYLVLNTSGRPLEFHCTSPVKANKAQEILYGPTLEPYLYGEQIASALLKKSKSVPTIVCTDCPPVLSVRSMVDTPVLLVEPESTEEQGSEQPESASTETKFLRFDEAHTGTQTSQQIKQTKFQLSDHKVAVCALHPEDQKSIEQIWREHISEIDLNEPFGRIQEAIQEAQQGGR